MFEKEAEEYAEGTKTEKEIEVLNTVHWWGQESLDPNERRLLEGIQDRIEAREQGFKDGAEFGYNKANEWHYVKDGDLPNVETKNYTYIRRRKRYERQFTDYRVIKCFVLCLNEKGKTTAKVGYFDCNRKCFFDELEGMVYTWKEIVLPEEIESC